MVAIYNVSSVLFGTLALILPMISLIRRGWRSQQFSYASFGCCILALFCQVGEAHRRIGLQDWSALADTWDFVYRAAYILMMAVLILNMILFKMSRK